MSPKREAFCASPGPMPPQPMSARPGGSLGLEMFLATSCAASSRWTNQSGKPGRRALGGAVVGTGNVFGNLLRGEFTLDKPQRQTGGGGGERAALQKGTTREMKCFRHNFGNGVAEDYVFVRALSIPGGAGQNFKRGFAKLVAGAGFEPTTFRL